MGRSRQAGTAGAGREPGRRRGRGAEGSPAAPPSPACQAPAAIRGPATKGGRATLAIIGATSPTGAVLSRALAAEGIAFVPVVRDLARWRALGLPVAGRLAAFEDPESLPRALGRAATVVALVPPRHLGQVIAAAPAGATLLAAIRNADPGAEAAEAAFLRAGRDGLLLRRGLTYGLQRSEDPVRRLAALIASLPTLPLPYGGMLSVQPIHVEDAARGVLAALRRDWRGPNLLPLAGPDALPWRLLLDGIAEAAGLPARPVRSASPALLRALLPLARRLPGLPKIRARDIDRLTVEEACDIAPLRRALGIAPLRLAAGLARCFAEAPLAPPPGPPHTPSGHAGTRHADHQPDRRVPS